jgi:hypothetical protein
MQRTSNINTNKNSTAGRANVNVNRNKDVPETKTSADYKPGSIAQRARLASRDSSGREEK